MKRAFLLLVLLCLLPIHALAQFITVPDEIYEALLADEVISSYASTKEELLPLITTLEGCDENNQAECAVIVTPPDGIGAADAGKDRRSLANYNALQFCAAEYRH